MTELHEGGQAAACGILRPGLILFAVNGQHISGLEFDQTLHLIKITPRPLALTFTVPKRPQLPPRVSPTASEAAGSEDVTEALPNFGGSRPGAEQGVTDTIARLASVSVEQVSQDYHKSSNSELISYYAGAAQPMPDVKARFGGGAPNAISHDGGATQGAGGGSGTNLAQHDMAVFRQKIEQAAKVIAPMSRRSEAARAALVETKAELGELTQRKEMLSSQLIYILTHSGNNATAAEGPISAAAVGRGTEEDGLGAGRTLSGGGTGPERIRELQERIEEAGRELGPMSQRLQAAEFEYMEARDELEDAVQRKRLLVQQLQLVMRGAEGAEGRLLVTVLTDEVRLRGSLAAQEGVADGASGGLGGGGGGGGRLRRRSAMGSAVVVARLGGSAFSAGQVGQSQPHGGGGGGPTGG